jgi:hypothetical protein
MEREVAAASEAFGRSHFHTRLWRRRLAALHGPRRRSTFNLSGGTIFDPSAIPFAIASVVAVILAWSSGVASSWQFGIYAGWCLICQLAALLLFLIARNTDATVRITLNQKITDSQTLNEK